MSVFATAKWDSDSDSAIDLNDYSSKADIRLIKKSGEEKTSSQKRKKLLKTSLQVTSKISETDSEISGSRKKTKNDQKLGKNISHKEENILRKYSSEIRKLATHSEKLNGEITREKKKQKYLHKKLDTALKKATLYKKLEELQTRKNGTVNEPSFSGETKEVNKKGKKRQEKLRELLQDEKSPMVKQLVSKEKSMSLKQKMEDKLKAARFRFLNEQIYKTDGREAQKIFQKDPDAFKAYHEGYRQQVKKWPLNPLDLVIRSIKKLPRTHVIADFGCGEARLGKSVAHKVHSFDLVAFDDTVTACDMAHVPLQDKSVDVAVFCLSLMGTNLADYLIEANRILKIGGLLKIVEVVSRFNSIEEFEKNVEQYLGFKIIWKDLSHNYFYFLDFKKVSDCRNKKKLPNFASSIQPCSYKKR